MYIGEAYFNGAWHSGVYPPIVDIELWNRAMQNYPNLPRPPRRLGAPPRQLGAPPPEKNAMRGAGQGDCTAAAPAPGGEQSG